MTVYLFSAIIQILSVYSTKWDDPYSTNTDLEISSKFLLWRWNASLGCLRYPSYYEHHYNMIFLLTFFGYFDQWQQQLLKHSRAKQVSTIHTVETSVNWMKQQFTSRSLCFLPVVSSWCKICMTFVHLFIIGKLVL